MCIICVLWNKGKLTATEANQAYSELVRGKPEDSHDLELKAKIQEALKKEEVEKK